MKKLLFVLLIFAFTVSVYGQQDGPIDLVLVLDTSTNMSSSYDNVNNYITGSFLTEFLRVGDTFHLIAFSQTPRLDVARRISASGDVETIVSRMMLQYPIERGSNVSGAITYAEQYITGLPSRPKKIVLVTTGGSDTANLVSSANQRLANRNATIDFVRVTPGQAITNTPKSGRAAASSGQGARSREQVAGGQVAGTTSVSTATSTDRTTGTTGAATTSAAGTTSVSTTTSTDRTTGTTSEKLEVRSEKWEETTSDRIRQDVDQVAGSREQVAGTTGAATTTGTDRTTDTTSEKGEGRREQWTTESGEQGTISNEELAINNEQGTTNGEQGAGGHSAGVTPQTTKESNGFSISSSSIPWIIGLILLLLLIIGLIMLLSSRRLGSSPNRVMAQVASSSGGSGMDRVDHSKDLARYAAGQSRRSTPYSDRPYKESAGSPVVINPNAPLLLNLFVEDQNTMIGKRNIHSLKSGYSLSVGGGKGDGFYIFLVPIPANIGELRRNGSSLSFIPKKAKYFPDIGSNEVRDCLGKTIRIISDKNYELRFRFEMYEDPLIALNRMLNSIKVPG